MINDANTVVVYYDSFYSAKTKEAFYGFAQVKDLKKKTEVINMGEGKFDNVSGSFETEVAGFLRVVEAYRKESKPIVIYTDSTYVIEIIENRIWKWQKNNWQTDLPNSPESLLRKYLEPIYEIIKNKPNLRVMRTPKTKKNNAGADLAHALAQASKGELYRAIEKHNIIGIL